METAQPDSDRTGLKPDPCRNELEQRLTIVERPMTTATNDGPESGKPVPRIDAVSDMRTRALDPFFAEMAQRDTSQPSAANRPTRVLLPPDSHPQCETPLAYRPASRRHVAPLHDDNPDGPRRIVKAMCVVLLLFAAFCFGGAAWFSSVPDRPAARAAVPASTRVTYVTKNIEDVRKGETVVAWDPVTGELGRREVTNTFERTSDHLRVLEFAADDDGQTQTLETTDEHPFWSVEAEDFVAAGDLCLGDRFISPAGEFSRLVATRCDEHPEGVPVYNFEVADVHNYYVRAHGLRAPPVRVHNASAGICGIGPTSARPAPKSRLPEIESLALFQLERCARRTR